MEDRPVPASVEAAAAADTPSVSALRGLRARFAGLGVIGRGAEDLRADAHTAQRQARLAELQRRQRRVA